MEFHFKLADVFAEEVSLVSNNLIPHNSPQLKRFGKMMIRQRVRNIINELGKASADAQQLHSIVTSAEKLENGRDVKLYIYCDFTENRVVGFLKIGPKKCFLFDDEGVEHELKAPCILDFYIHETRQRKGAGKFLMDHVLQKENIHVTHFAVDYPTDKMVLFLRKHYNMTHVFPQFNNLLLFDGFFGVRPDYGGGKVVRWTGVDEVTDKPSDVVFHFDDVESRLTDSVEYLLKHPHPKHRKTQRDGTYKPHLSVNGHESEIHDHHTHNLRSCNPHNLRSSDSFPGNHTNIHQPQCQH